MLAEDFFPILIPVGFIAVVLVLFGGVHCGDKALYNHQLEMAKLGCSEEIVMSSSGSTRIWKCPTKLECR
jgi:hypothetical protein